jgi:two-component system, OmpR family, phosphate regulon sensor histidine kinase PhoR
MFSSYRLRLTLGYVAVIAVLALAWTYSLFGPLTDAVKGQQQSHLANIARAEAVALQHEDVPAQTFAKELGNKDLRVTVVAADGTVLADSHNDPARMENHAKRPEVAAALAGQTGSDVRLSATERIEQMYVAVPAEHKGRHVALRVSESLASVAALAASARSTGILALVLALAVSLFVTARLSANALAPIRRLADAAHGIARGEAGWKVPQEAGELGVLSDALGDLAEQVRTRMAASELEQTNLRTVLDGLDDAVLLVEDDVVRLANSSVGRMFRTPFGGWRDRKLEDTTLPASLLKAVAEAQEAQTRSVCELGPDPTGRTLRLAVIPVGPPEPQRRALIVVSDVSERARVDAMRRDFVANASHELKTPTSAIQLLAEAAGTASSDGDVDQALVFVGQMRNEADRLRKLVLDLLDLSRLEQVGEPETVTDVREAVDLALTGHRAAAEAKGLTLEADFSAVEGEDVFLAVEPTDVAIALDNLLANAVSYTERGGVAVRVSTAEDGRVRIEVVDTGLGIPPESLPRVFERFFRVDKGRSRDSGGTGLGLSLVRHVSERNAGDVSIASEVGAGTTVTLLLPRAV